MKTLFLSIVISLFAVLSTTAQHKHNKPKTGSPAASTSIELSKSTISVDYHSPSVRGRLIWGGLVGFDQIWVTGAHNATKLSFTEDVTIGGVQLLKGSYALFTIPGRGNWTVVINRNWEQHLADDYGKSLDVVRFKVRPTFTTQTEMLTYSLKEVNPKTAELSMAWDKLKISFPIEIN